MEIRKMKCSDAYVPNAKYLLTISGKQIALSESGLLELNDKLNEFVKTKD